MEFPTCSLAEIERYLNLTGKKGTMAISILGRLNKYINQVIESEIGQELIKADINRFEELLLKIADETATDMEKAEFRYIKMVRMPQVIEKIKIYLNQMMEIKKVANVR